MQTASFQHAIDQIRTALATYADSARAMQETLQRRQQALARLGRAADEIRATRPVALAAGTVRAVGH